MTSLNKLTIEGFGSIIVKMEFHLNIKGLNIMRGKIGSGKTSIPSSLYWCVFGKTLKKGSTVETWPELRRSTYKGTMVRLDFSSNKEDYSIIRCVNYKSNVIPKVKGNSKLILLKDGKDISNKGKAAVQKQIQNIMGYSPELFINSIIYGQRLKRIIEESGPNKKKLFDEAFETFFIEKARVKADGEKSKIKEEISNLEMKHAHVTTEIGTNTYAYNSLLSSENSFETNKKRILKEHKASMQNIKLKIKRVRDEIKKIPIIEEFDDNGKYNDKIQELKTKLTQVADLQKQAKQWELEIELLKENRHDTKGKKCYVCNSIMNEAKHKKMVKGLEDRIKKLEDQIKANKNLASKFDIDTINSDIKKAEKKLKEYESNINNLKSNNRLRDTLERQLNGYHKDLTDVLAKYEKEKKTKLKIESTKYKERIDALKKEATNIAYVLEPLQDELTRLNWAIKDPLSNSGIKAYIFSNLLSQVNQRLYEYGDILGFRVEFGIDLETNSKDFYQMIYKDDIIINYPDLSGGQKQLVDTAVALALHNVISNVRPINLLFLDEVFEGLDIVTIELVMELITYISKKKAVFLITHNQLFKPSNAWEISFELDKYGNTILS